VKRERECWKKKEKEVPGGYDYKVEDNDTKSESRGCLG